MSVVGVVLLTFGVVLTAATVWVGGGLLRFVVDRSAFRCRLSRRGRWCRCKTTARWRKDVLLVRVGPLWMRTKRIPVRSLPPTARIADELAWVATGLGHRPQCLTIRGADGELRIAVRKKDRMRLAGPFLGLALYGPPAPRSDRHPRP